MREVELLFKYLDRILIVNQADRFWVILIDLVQKRLFEPFMNIKSESWLIQFITLSMMILITPFHIKSQDIGWSEIEKETFLYGCQLMTSEHDFPKNKIDDYCQCTLNEIIHSYPEQPPSADSWDNYEAEIIADYCLETVLDYNKVNYSPLDFDLNISFPGEYQLGPLTPPNEYFTYMYQSAYYQSPDNMLSLNAEFGYLNTDKLPYQSEKRITFLEDKLNEFYNNIEGTILKKDESFRNTDNSNGISSVIKTDQQSNVYNIILIIVDDRFILLNGSVKKNIYSDQFHQFFESINLTGQASN
jgi:hypothetical protein